MTKTVRYQVQLSSLLKSNSLVSQKRYNVSMNRSWYNLSKDEKSPDQIHQILAFGTFDEIRLLRKNLGDREVKKLFLNYPKKVYTSSAFNFIKKFILHIGEPIDEQKYLKTTARNIR